MLQQCKRLYNDVRQGSKPLGGYEDLNPHGYIQTMNPNSVCIFGHQINKEQLKGEYEYWKYKKIPYSSKASLCVGVAC